MAPALTIGVMAGGAAVVMTLRWHAAMSKYGVCGQQTRADVEMQKEPERNDENACVRLIGVRSMCTNVRGREVSRPEYSTGRDP